MIVLTTSIWQQISKLIDNGVAVWCAAFELTDGEAVYLVRNTEPLTFKSKTWTPFPFAVSPVDDAGEGDLPETTIALSNVSRSAMQYLESGSWDQGRCSLFLVLHATAEQILRFDFTIQAATATHEAVTLKLGRPNLFDKPFPATRYMRSAGYPGIQTN